MKSYNVALSLTSLISSVAAHGFIRSPTPRMPGKGLEAACGTGVYNTEFYDHFGNVQGARQNLQGSYPDCRLWHCKGVPFSDAGEIHSFTAGQKIPMTIDIRAPHDGVANVSIVKVSSDAVIGAPLISWDAYALTSSPVSAHPEWTDFEITMPDVSDECANAGDCVIQWFWDAPRIDQTYESCIDFSMGGRAGSGNGTAPETPASSAPASSAPASSAPASSAPASSAPVSPAPASSAPASSAPASSAPASSAPASSAAPISSATPTPAAPAATPSPSKVAAVGASAMPSAAAGSGSALPKMFTIETFIAWLEENAGSAAAAKIRRMAATERAHARAFAA